MNLILILKKSGEVIDKKSSGVDWQSLILTSGEIVFSKRKYSSNEQFFEIECCTEYFSGSFDEMGKDFKKLFEELISQFDF